MHPSRSFPKPLRLTASLRLSPCSFARLGVFVFLLLAATPLPTQAQFGNPIDTQHIPPPIDQSVTNQIDLNRDGLVDFEIVQRHTTSTTADLSGIRTLHAWHVSWVPQNGTHILASNTPDTLQGDVPILAHGDLVGPTTPGRHWSPNTHTLVQRVEPTFLVGPLASVWAFAPGYAHIGIRLGSPDAPTYGWVCFHRDRGMDPIFWGYSRIPANPVSAGDRTTAPPLTLQSVVKPGPSLNANSVVLTWVPPFSEVTLEERSGFNFPWKPVSQPQNPTFRIPNFTIDLNSSAPNGNARFFRVYFGNP